MTMMNVLDAEWVDGHVSPSACVSWYLLLFGGFLNRFFERLLLPQQSMAIQKQKNLRTSRSHSQSFANKNSPMSKEILKLSLLLRSCNTLFLVLGGWLSYSLDMSIRHSNYYRTYFNHKKLAIRQWTVDVVQFVRYITTPNSTWISVSANMSSPT